ncbi:MULTISPECIES: L,D-transpeptidase family protein [Halomonadaceae]|uniref:L,D-transpeptidase family protein n=1 Tax=Halomonadaceae TaxID=28256 RepID=UPI0015819778|nr:MULTISPECIES: L,D-transpeptidase [Halomonas]MDI4639030.1 L,D-transpeptidase [Halomonas sp. BMC7]NUJ60020.1 L,D-transpeptidase [Halomonas taeanensis]
MPRLILLLVLMLLPLGTALGAVQSPAFLNPGPHELWLLIDQSSSSLRIYRGERMLERFAPVSVGRGGVKRLRRQGDSSTPSGVFRINRVKFDSDFHIFLGIDFPTAEHAREAWEAGMMTAREYGDFMSDLRRTGAPPQDTVLGGYIGIHGLGEADPEIHRRFNWTQGCVAVTNSQIDHLADMVTIGTRVVIR